MVSPPRARPRFCRCAAPSNPCVYGPFGLLIPRKPDNFEGYSEYEDCRMIAGKPDSQRIVITGVGLAAPNGNDLVDFRKSLLNGTSGVRPYDIRYVGATLAGVCSFDE